LVCIENLGLVHGDLPPANILLDTCENIKLVDFDATVKKGEQLMVASEPFCKLDADYETPLAGPLSEQFSLASCIYTIRFGHIPFHHLKAPARVQDLIKNIFPTTSTDTLFGNVTEKCWRGDYESLAMVKQDILSFFVGHPPDVHHVAVGLDDMVRECQEFLERERTRDKLPV
jgi:serine/threonine protein kinase